MAVCDERSLVNPDDYIPSDLFLDKFNTKQLYHLDKTNHKVSLPRHVGLYASNLTCAEPHLHLPGGNLTCTIAYSGSSAMQRGPSEPPELSFPSCRTAYTVEMIRKAAV